MVYHIAQSQLLHAAAFGKSALSQSDSRAGFATGLLARWKTPRMRANCGAAKGIVFGEPLGQVDEDDILYLAAASLRTGAVVSRAERGSGRRAGPASTQG